MTPKQAKDLCSKMDQLLERAQWLLAFRDDSAQETVLLTSLPTKVIPTVLKRLLDDWENGTPD